MNEIINKFLLTEDRFMPEMHLRQAWFTYSACKSFTKNKDWIKKFNKTENSRHIYQNQPDHLCFQHDMAYADFKDLHRRTIIDKILYDKAFNIPKNKKYDRYQHRLASVVYKCFDKNTFNTLTWCGICWF